MKPASFPFWKVYGAGIVLAFLTLAGLLVALFGDGFWDAASWLLLALPLAVLIWYVARSSARRRRKLVA